METFKREIFEAIGNLFYAVAKEQQIHPLELGELKLMMQKDWITEPGHVDRTPVNEAAHLICLTLDALEGEHTPGKEAYKTFATFYATHREQFSDALKHRIFSTAIRIAEVFHGNHARSSFLGKIEQLFQDANHVVK